jgi:hypothetical protein
VWGARTASCVTGRRWRGGANASLRGSANEASNGTSAVDDNPVKVHLPGSAATREPEPTSPSGETTTVRPTRAWPTCRSVRRSPPTSVSCAAFSVARRRQRPSMDIRQYGAGRRLSRLDRGGHRSGCSALWSICWRGAAYRMRSSREAHHGLTTQERWPRTIGGMAAVTPTAAGVLARGVRERGDGHKVVPECPGRALGLWPRARLAIGLAVANGDLGLAVWLDHRAREMSPMSLAVARGHTRGGGCQGQVWRRRVDRRRRVALRSR